jgi:hypothetical protein
MIDCVDNNPNINPFSDEVCDRVDNNCDGEVNEGEVCKIKTKCPRFKPSAPGWCSNGTIVYPGPDEFGCISHPICNL